MTRSILALVLFASCGAPTASSPSAKTDAHLQAVAARTAEDPALVWTPSAVALMSREVAPGVFAVFPDDAAPKNAAGIPVATSGGFVVGTTGVLLVDTMINRGLATQMLALVREKTDKPILYAVNTSYHGDHSYGNQFLPSETKVIQHEKTQAYIREHFVADVAFMTQNFGSASGLQELAPQAAHILLKDGETKAVDLGGVKVTIRHLGFAQTEGDLFVSVGNVLFTGNPIISEGPSMPWLLDGHSDLALATLQRLRTTFGPSTIVIPGHGVPTTMAAVDAHIAYLEELRREVAVAVAKGLDEKETSAQVSDEMRSVYGQYKIYPWVHTQLNVAKVYAELKASR